MPLTTLLNLGDDTQRVFRCDHETWHFGANYWSHTDNRALTDADVFVNDTTDVDKQVIRKIDSEVFPGQSVAKVEERNENRPALTGHSMLNSKTIKAQRSRASH